MKRLLFVLMLIFVVVIGNSCAPQDSSSAPETVAASVAPAEPVAAPQTLKEIGELFVGRWIGEVTWAVDYPGVGKKGEKVSAYIVCSWVNDGNTLQCVQYAGQSTGRGLTWWDAASKEIKNLWIDSGGNWDLGTITKQGMKWAGQSSGGFPDGRQVQYKWEWTFEDGGNRFTSTGATILAGAENPFRDVFRKVGK
jgi:hypothetical protein